MIFSEAIEQILFERGLTSKELALKLGISSIQVENLRTGKTKMPRERISNAITNYCKKYNIDIDINWNDVLYDIFISFEQFRDYIWVRDVNDEGYVLLKHKRCKKNTLVPKDAFTNKSMPCIHCWVDRYVSSDVYNVALSENDYCHEFIHKCGYSYSVTYDEIKRKEFRCPVCSGYKYNADNLHRKKSTQSRQHPNKIWSECLKSRIEKLANENNFSIEEKDSVYCSFNYQEMTDEQCALICNSCFDSKIFDKSGSSIDKAIEFINKHKYECEKPDDCIVENTRKQKIVWIPDMERILYMVSLIPQGDAFIPHFLEKIRNGEYSHESYIAANPNLDDDKTANILFHYYKDNDKTDYINLLIATKPSQFCGMIFYSYPKAYADMLYEQIQQSLQQHVDNTVFLQHTCDEYVDVINYFRDNSQDVFLAAAFSKAMDAFKSHSEDTNIARQQETKKLLSMQHCPVCRNLHKSTTKTCAYCDFDELGKCFINKDEYKLWLDEVVAPKREKWEKHA